MLPSPLPHPYHHSTTSSLTLCLPTPLRLSLSFPPLISTALITQRERTRTSSLTTTAVIGRTYSHTHMDVGVCPAHIRPCTLARTHTQRERQSDACALAEMCAVMYTQVCVCVLDFHFVEWDNRAGVKKKKCVRWEGGAGETRKVGQGWWRVAVRRLKQAKTT